MRTMVETPTNFEFKSSEKTERVLELFRFEAPRRLQCPECEAVFHRAVFEKKLKQFLNQDPASEHLIDQLDSQKDLLNWACPNCRRTVGLQKAPVNHRKRIPSNGDLIQ
ncbi:hypothetical protein GKQ38_00835 [Candidatus Nanohaloarchaea archaeon]|nr:hypothetical protein GKQ38_00835 [Candidatus Nanohaloarchaea archaeon]